MSTDPWSRPTMEDLRQVLESIGKKNPSNVRAAERLELSVPAEVITERGNTVAAMTREISRTGIGVIHRGSISLGEVRIRIASDTRDFEYHVKMEWCNPCENGMFMSGGSFVTE